VPAIQIEKILLPTDFSAPSQVALRYAKAFAQLFGARLVLLHVVEPIASAGDFGYGPVVCLRPDPRSIQRSQKQLHALERRQLDSECQCDTLVRSGVVSDEIAKAAKELKADLIIIATRGQNSVKQALHDSTAERVARCAACPVLVVHENAPEYVPQPAIARSHYENQTRN
jgi:nucleotide-binding universal stress UspA family protein